MIGVLAKASSGLGTPSLTRTGGSQYWAEFNLNGLYLYCLHDLYLQQIICNKKTLKNTYCLFNPTHYWLLKELQYQIYMSFLTIQSSTILPSPALSIIFWLSKYNYPIAHNIVCEICFVFAMPKKGIDNAWEDLANLGCAWGLF